MKLAVVGGSGVRSPLMVGAMAKRAVSLGLSEVAIYDIDPGKVAVFVPLMRLMLKKLSAPFTVTACTRPEEALEGASYLITTIRPGFEQARVYDEDIPLSLGVVGQETTGPGGLAMACRSVPAILQYAHTFFRYNPKGWIINFTNPAGLVAQSLFDAGFDRVVGICDSANNGAIFAADYFHRDFREFSTRVWGLNHLSYTDYIGLDGENVLPRLLADDGFLTKAQPYYRREEVRALGCYLNEYLYYFYHTAQAVAGMQAEGETRGRKIMRMNRELLAALTSLVTRGDLQGALDHYFAYNRERTGSYMSYAREDEGHRYLPKQEEEGYAGVALDLVEIFEGRAPARDMAVSVPNGGALPFLAPGDVAEMSCLVSREGLTPRDMPEVPAGPKELITRVKEYERLTVAAIRAKRFATAVDALAVHPLVPDRATAQAIMQQYQTAHAPFFEGWM